MAQQVPEKLEIMSKATGGSKPVARIILEANNGGTALFNSALDVGTIQCFIGPGQVLFGNFLGDPTNKDAKPSKLSTMFFSIGGRHVRTFFQVHDADGKTVLSIDSQERILSIGDTIQLDAKEGDIKLLGADCAENFDLAVEDQVDAGTVMVIAESGKLRQCTEAYDKRVAGVLSGAGDCKPGILLNSAPVQNAAPLALSGKTFCKVNANYGAISAGDLLTTSTTPGHAMKADDPARAWGCTIGKALQGLAEGNGMIPILIALQ